MRKIGEGFVQGIIPVMSREHFFLFTKPFGKKKYLITTMKNASFAW